jgi:hypothetical protein
VKVDAPSVNPGAGRICAEGVVYPDRPISIGFPPPSML